MSDADSAKQILDVIPRTMRMLRTELRSYAKPELTVPQFRILVHLTEAPRNNGQLAEIQGVSVAAMSRMVDGLVRRGLIERVGSTTDRRQIQLVLSDDGQRLCEKITTALQKSLSLRIAKLDKRPRQNLQTGLNILGEMFP